MNKRLTFSSLKIIRPETVKDGQRYTDYRMRLIENEGQITLRALSEKIGVTTAAISQRLKPLIEKGVLN